MKPRPITARERLHHFFFHEPMDRPAVVIRWWGFRDDPSYHDLFALMTAKADWIEPWDARSLLRCPGTPAGTPPDPLRVQEQAERWLTEPLPAIDRDIAPFLQLRDRVGSRGIVLAALGNNPGGAVASRFGSESFAILSVDNRPLLHELMAREQASLLRLLDVLIEGGVGPYFAIHGQEMIAPPLHSREDFFDFNVHYDRALADRIHAAGGRLTVHCHGRIRQVLDGFLALGADVLHPFEAPPMGDVEPAEVKQAMRGRASLEGNIQIADLYDASPDDIRRQTERLIRDCFDDHRGLAISPSASPFMPGRGGECFARYKAMVETVLAYAS